MEALLASSATADCLTAAWPLTSSLSNFPFLSSCSARRVQPHYVSNTIGCLMQAWTRRVW
jgi:hypothetical protein